jgi:hypothetical protein
MSRLFAQWRSSRGPSYLDLFLRFALGVALGIFLNYILYRMSLPAEPFIYASF